ncbi:hypothetical protein NQ318_021547 [Aromia moschata]|uniref:Uncharacterized protein n=1 Tax=Aromia moschata TaxID=1265417 RepID=A0AAV8ZDC4_9CUCU|nr:hypothetical protein NQ318_021547 [Aromia moschata]
MLDTNCGSWSSYLAPTTSLQVAQQIGLSHESVRKVLKLHKFHPYKLQITQELGDDDPNRRVGALGVRELKAILNAVRFQFDTVYVCERRPRFKRVALYIRQKNARPSRRATARPVQRRPCEKESFKSRRRWRRRRATRINIGTRRAGARKLPGYPPQPSVPQLVSACQQVGVPAYGDVVPSRITATLGQM